MKSPTIRFTRDRGSLMYEPSWVKNQRACPPSAYAPAGLPVAKGEPTTTTTTSQTILLPGLNQLRRQRLKRHPRQLQAHYYLPRTALQIYARDRVTMDAQGLSSSRKSQVFKFVNNAPDPILSTIVTIPAGCVANIAAVILQTVL